MKYILYLLVPILIGCKHTDVVEKGKDRVHVIKEVQFKDGEYDIVRYGKHTIIIKK